VNTPVKVVLYLRCSTSKQTTENQRIALEEVCQRNGWQIYKVIEDAGVSGAKGKDERPGFNELHRIVSRKEADMIVVWSIDRLGRSITDLVSFMSELAAKNFNFYSHTQAIDSRTPAGKLTFAIFASLAEFERNLISERVHAGLERAKRNGVKLGRPSNANSNTGVAVKLLREKGYSIGKIAKQLGIGCSTTMRFLAA
jgi:DNA invertase Pin-like site-specific DNA recombinase